MMKKKCPKLDCINNIKPSCAIIDITGKVPKKYEKCSYYRDETTKKKHGQK